MNDWRMIPWEANENGGGRFDAPTKQQILDRFSRALAMDDLREKITDLLMDRCAFAGYHNHDAMEDANAIIGLLFEMRGAK